MLNKQWPKQRISNPKKYSTDSYKNEQVSRSIDWSSYKNPLIPPPKKERPSFVKIDYLRFQNKKEMFENPYGSVPNLAEPNSTKKDKLTSSKSIPLYKLPHKTRSAVKTPMLQNKSPEKDGS